MNANRGIYVYKWRKLRRPHQTSGALCTTCKIISKSCASCTLPPLLPRWVVRLCFNVTSAASPLLVWQPCASSDRQEVTNRIPSTNEKLRWQGITHADVQATLQHASDSLTTAGSYFCFKIQKLFGSLLTNKTKSLQPHMTLAWPHTLQNANVCKVTVTVLICWHLASAITTC